MIRKFFIFLLGFVLSAPAAFGQISTLSGTTDSLTALLGGAAAVTNPTYSVTTRSTQGIGATPAIGRTNGSTPVVLATGPARGITFVDSIVIYNADTAAVTVTINKISGGVTYALQQVTLPSLATFTWNNTGIRVTDNGGQVLQTLSSGLMTNSIGASTAAAGSTTTDAGVLPAATATTYPTTAANGTTGVRIHASDKVTGRVLYIGNGVSNQILKVYGPSGATINGGSADAAFSSVSGKGVIIQCLSSASNTWLAW